MEASPKASVCEALTVARKDVFNPKSQAAIAPRHDRVRILLVEDDGMIAWLMSDTLIAMGYEVCGIAGCEEDAVAMAAREHPDLLLVDAHLEVGSGLGAVRRILLAGPVPHIFISGDKISAEHLSFGAVALQKPFQDADLARAINHVLFEH